MAALTLTSLLPTIYEAMDVVSREMVGFIPAVARDSSAERAALNQTVMSPVVGAMTAEDINVGAYPADTPAQTIGNVSMSITKARSVPFGVTGEENRGLNTAGTMGEKLNDAGSGSSPWTEVIEASYTAAEILRILAAHAAGSATGLEGANPQFTGLDGTTVRIDGTYSAGTRTIDSLDGA